MVYEKACRVAKVGRKIIRRSYNHNIIYIGAFLQALIKSFELYTPLFETLSGKVDEVYESSQKDFVATIFTVVCIIRLQCGISMPVVLTCTVANRKVPMQSQPNANRAQPITLNDRVRRLGAYHDFSTACKLDIAYKTILHSKNVFDGDLFFVQGRAEGCPPRTARDTVNLFSQW